MSVTQLLDRWLDYLTPLREAGTIRGYRNHSKAIKTALGNVPMPRLTAQHLDRAYRAWLAEGRAARTVRRGELCAGFNRGRRQPRGKVLISRRPTCRVVR
ncbi:MAG TPA: hypothetical protein VME46_18075 [Acidimicrobiales bacterium]|nr:hypothetical protein [Acidimicrobiales bacterium]